MKFILIILFVFLSSSTPVNAAEPCHEDIKMVMQMENSHDMNKEDCNEEIDCFDCEKCHSINFVSSVINTSQLSASKNDFISIPNKLIKNHKEIYKPPKNSYFI